jgi:hypothetical protein
MEDGALAGRRLSEEEARRIWRRAAELQARAADVAARGTLPVPAERVEDLDVADVTAAAVEAGIGSEYVQLALAEMETGTIASGHRAGVQKVGRKLIGEPFDGVEASRTIGAPPEEVHATLLRLFTSAPFGLVLTDTRGAARFVDDVLVFDAEAVTFSQTPFQTKLNFGDVKRLYVTLRPSAGDCRVHISAPFERRKLNLFFSGLFTAAGGVAGTGIGVAVAALVGTTVLAVPAAIGAVGALAGATGFRGIYRWSVRQVLRALEQLLGAVAADVHLRRTGPGVGLPPAAGPMLER